MTVRVLLILATACAAVHAIGISPKIDLPGVARPRRVLGTDALDPEKVQAVLQVKVKSGHSDNSDTKVNAVVCLNSDSSKCLKKQSGIRPSIDLNSDESEEEDIKEEKWRKMDESSEEESGEEEEEEEDEEEVKVTKSKRKPLIIVVQGDELVTEDKKKSKKKTTPDVPVIVGYKGVTADEENQFQNEVHIVPSGSAYSHEQTLEDVPVYAGLNLRPEFDNSRQTYSYINAPPSHDIPVTYKQVPFGFDESALVAHIFETSPLIKSLQAKYDPFIQHSGVHTLTPRVAVSDTPDYVAGMERTFFFPKTIPGFYGGHQPRVYPPRGIVRPGTQGCYYPPKTGWTPSIQGKVSFTSDEEEPSIRGSQIPIDTDDANTSDSPTVIKIDGKLGGALEGLKT